MTRFKALSTTIVMVGSLFGLLVGLCGPLGNLAANHWREKLHNAPDEEVRPLLRQAAALGEPGISVLVESLGSSRECVAIAARDVLDSLLNGWQRHPRPGDSAKLGTLAHELASRVGSFGPTARDDAADLATRILLWPPDAKAVDRGSLVADCQRVLQTAPLAQRPREQTPAVVSSEPEGTAEETPTASNIEELVLLPGGGLPVGGLESPDLLRAPGVLHDPSLSYKPVGRSRATDSDDDVAGHGADSHVATDEPRGYPPRRLQLPEQEVGKPLDADSSQQRITPHPPPLRSQRPRSDAVRPISLQDAAMASDAPTGFESDDPLNLIHQLRSTDTSLAGKAESELSRRGFRTLHFELARRLSHADPRIRIKLARTLPAMQSVDATTWLLWLCKDEDPGVRLTAIGLLATTADPVLLAKIEQIAATDSDPRVRQQARRLATQRR
jgi:hypothetical protein